MLLDLIQSGDIVEALLSLLVIFPAILLALTLHEVSHGFVAYKLGDPTAKAMGRLTLNPLKHLDPIGTILMLVTGYGWAKPVPINVRYFKDPKKGMALTAFAGPFTNLIIGFLSAVIYAALYRLSFLGVLTTGVWSIVFDILIIFFLYFAMINVTYAIFNLFPLPPFDGSRIFLTFLPTKWYFAIMKYERIIMMIVLVGMASGYLWTPIARLIDTVFNAMITLAFTLFPL